MSFGSSTPGGAVEGIGGNEYGIGMDSGYGEGEGINSPYSAAQQEALFRQKIDPLMSNAYNPVTDLAGKITGFALNTMFSSVNPLLGMGMSLTGTTGKITDWLRDNAVSQEISEILGVKGAASVPEALARAYDAGKSEQEIASAYNLVSGRRGGVMGLWEDITGQSSAKAASGAAGTAASYQQQSLDYLKEMGAIPLAAQQGLAGIYGLPGGTGSQEDLISRVQASPMYSTMMQSGEEAIMRQAGATGGLRSGNVQDALARYSGDVTSQLYGQELAGLTGLAGLSTYGSQVGQGISSIGNTLATGQMLASQAEQQGMSNLLGIGGAVYQNLGGLSGISSGIGGMWEAGKTGYESGGLLSGIGKAIGSLF